MMSHRYLFTDERPEALFDVVEGAVAESFDFGPAGGAVRISDEQVPVGVEHEGAVRDVVGDDSVELRMAEDDLDGDGIADAADVRSLHRFAEGGTGEGVTVAVTDSGVDLGHHMVQGRDIECYDATGLGARTDAVGHGTAVMGLIALLAPRANLISIRMFGNEGRTGMTEVLRTYERLFRLADRIDVVNMSWGTTGTRVEALDRLQTKLTELGVRDVVSAGNSGGAGGSPATAEGTFSVGACTLGGEVAKFSSYDFDADNPDVMAVGRAVKLAQARSTVMGRDLPGPWVSASGTSFSAPIVAGSVACILSEHPDADIEAVYEAAAADVEGTERDGAGLLDHQAILGALREAPEEPETPSEEADGPSVEATADSTVWSLWESGEDVMHIDANWLPNGRYTVKKMESDDDRTHLVFEIDTPDDAGRVRVEAVEEEESEEADDEE